ncbi:hypothetical protein [Carnobacterium inhibens]|uniref:Uncharacterized protein n=1 Tax=Carnobacterium inhibens subsp. gilichinskyi TaxID=1266845 RepID=U5SBZ5_9LACT|nr:hypothetical protein [Carnobacterium inhibens]AGY82819.1 hypothetical protein Q783_06785 [Carnobacterium inhibens subsp. gilichinskyi]
MKKRFVHILLVLGLMLLVNYGNQTVWAAPSEEIESTPAMETEKEEAGTENTLIVSDKVIVEPKKTRFGEQVTFSLTLLEEPAFETIVLNYYSNETKAEKEVTLTHDSETQRYTGQLESGSTSVGQWQLIQAIGMNKESEPLILETIPLMNEDQELKQSDFEVLAHPSALLDLSSIKVEPKDVKVGEKLQFSLKTSENTVVINEAVVFRSTASIDEEGNHAQLTLQLMYNEETKSYEGESSNFTNEMIGDWVIDSIQATDGKGNPFILYNQFVIEHDRANVQVQIDELKKQLAEAQSVDELDEIEQQEKINLLTETIQQLEKSKGSKEKLLQADLSLGDFTVVEQPVEENPEPIKEEVPVKNQEKQVGKKDSDLPLVKPFTPKKQKDDLLETNVLDDVLKKEQKPDDNSEKKTAANESIQSMESSPKAEEKNSQEESESTIFSNGTLLIVVAAFVLINGFIFKF